MKKPFKCFSAKKSLQIISFAIGCTYLSSYAVQVGQGTYYDNAQISKLAARYPARVSKDAGYPLADNYVTLKSSYAGSTMGLKKMPTTGQWWTPLLAIDKKASDVTASDYLNPMMVTANPLTMQFTQSGIRMGIPVQNNNIVDNVHVDRGYDNTLDLTITTGDLTGTAPLVFDYSDWAVTTQYANNNNPLLQVTAAEGSPFLFFDKRNNQGNIFLTFTISQAANLLSAKDGINVFKTRNASDASKFRYYAVFTRPGTNNVWRTAANATITPADQGGSGSITPNTQINTADSNQYFTVAIIPADTDANAISIAGRMRPYAFSKITNTQVAYRYDDTNAKVITDFNFTTTPVYSGGDLKNQALTMLFPIHVDNMTTAQKSGCFFGDNCASNQGVIKTLRGDMRLFVAPSLNSAQVSSFTTQITFNGVIPQLPNTLTTAQTAKLKAYSFDVSNDPHLDATNPWTDTYATGKRLSTQAQLLKVADTLIKSDGSFQNVKDRILRQLKNQLNSFFTGYAYTACPATGSCSPNEGAWFFAYQNKWGSFMGFPSGFFTATTMTDHHFHYGYFLDAAATVAQFDKNWAKQYGGIVNVMVRDLWDYTVETKQNLAPAYAHFKNFDPYSGLSSALGMPYSMDNVNEEASSEFMNFAQALILWGINTDGVSFDGDSVTTSKALRDLGLYLYATEEQAISYYHFNRHPTSGVYPTNWQNSSTGQKYLMVGNVWGGKLDRSTYFCAGQPCYYQNLASNSFPVIGGTLYMGLDPNFVLSVYRTDAMNPCSGDKNNQAYCGSLLKYLALGDATNAMTYYTAFFDTQNNQPDPGDTKANIYYWIANLQNLGTVSTSVTADLPTAVAFSKNNTLTLAAYNGSSTAKDVKFYSTDGKLACTLKGVPAYHTVNNNCDGTAPNDPTGPAGPNDPKDPTDPPSGDAIYSYMVYIAPPFNVVTINNTIKCPDPVTKNPACLSNKQAAGATLTIQGAGQHFCSLAIQTDGSLKINGDKSNYCFINSSASSKDKAGVINLPGAF